MLPLCRLSTRPILNPVSPRIRLIWKGRTVHSVSGIHPIAGIPKKVDLSSKKVDLSFCLVTNWAYDSEKFPLYYKIMRAVEGGVTHVQVRGSASELIKNRDLARRLINSGVKVIFNGDPGSVQATGAHGFHGGEFDLPIKYVRQFLGPQAVIGYTVNSPEDVRKAIELRPDYIGVQIFRSNFTKRISSCIWGIEGLRWIQSQIGPDLPVIVIGHIYRYNLREICPHLKKIDGIATVGDLFIHDDPLNAAQEFTAILHEYGLSNRQST